MQDYQTQFYENPYAWNNEASVLYIEQPAGVGYSFCNSTEDCTFNDDSSAADNLKVVLAWFEKFPEYKTNELYISGESYAGIYVPLLVNEIDQHNQLTNVTFKPNLKGFMVGNGVTNWTYDGNPAYAEFSYWHSFIDTNLRDMIKENNCTLYEIDDSGYTDICKDLTERFEYFAYGNLYVYDPIFSKCIHSSDLEARTGYVTLNGERKSYKKGFTMHEYTPWIKRIKNNRYGEDIEPCIDGMGISEYLNSPDVRRVLHIPEWV
jgi:serine carboxypeptidase-like clade 2